MYSTIWNRASQLRGSATSETWPFSIRQPLAMATFPPTATVAGSSSSFDVRAQSGLGGLAPGFSAAASTAGGSTVMIPAAVGLFAAGRLAPEGRFRAFTYDATGNRTWQYVKIGDLPALAPLGSTVSIWSQAAWTHSVSMRTGLTTAERCTPDFSYKLSKDLAKKKCLYTTDNTTPTGSGPYDSFLYMPIIRYN